jgi:uroporphyrinogen-III decarboxylase
MMLGKERILAALAGQEPDRLCWSPLIDPYFTTSLPEQGYDECDVPDAVRLAGGDIIERHCPTVQRVEDGSITRHFKRQSDVEREVIETPVGSLTTERRISATGHTNYLYKRPILTLEDLKTYEYLLEHTSYVEDFDAFRERMHVIGQDGIATSSGPMTPLQEFFQAMSGIENTIYLLNDHPAEIEACFALMHEKNVEVYRLICEGPTQVVIDYENTSSTVLSPNYYLRYCAPLIDEYADICHQAGKWFITHMCGKLTAFSEPLREGRQDGIDSVCPPSTGDLWAHEAREAWGEEKVIIGGIDPAVLVWMSVDEVKDYITYVLNRMPTFRRFILSTGDATAYGTPLENLRAVGEIVAKYGWK